MAEFAIGPQNKRRVQKSRQRRNAFGAKRRQAFLEHLAATCNVTAARRKAGVAAATPYMARMRDPAFAEQWRLALEQGYARLEAALVRRSVEAAEGRRAIARGAGASEAELDAIDPKFGLHLLQLHRRGLERAPGDLLPRRSDIEGARQRLEKKMRALNLVDRDGVAGEAEGEAE